MSDEELTPSEDTQKQTLPNETEEPIVRADLRALFVPKSGEDTVPLEIAETDEAKLEAETQTENETPEAEEPPPIIYHYRVSVVLLDELERQISVARQSVGMESALIGSFIWQPDFKTEQIEPIQAALREWVKTHLPLAVTVERVETLVEGKQRYITAFALEPAESIRAAQTALLTSLKEEIEPVTVEDHLPFAPRLPIADHIAPTSFLPLVQMLQLNFDPVDWRIEAVELLRVPEGDHRWEVLEQFSV